MSLDIVTGIPEETTGVKEVVLSFIDSINKEDFFFAGKYLDERMQFIGVLGSRDGAVNYMSDMQEMKLKYDIKKAFVNERDVCLIYDLSIDGKFIEGCGWYHVNNENKIDQLKVLFDPRPLLENATT